MIHWGADLPPAFRQCPNQMPSDQLLITPVNKPLFYASNPRLGSSLSMLDLLKSLENLDKTNGESTDSLGTPESLQPKTNLSRQKSRSCEGLKIMKYKKSTPARLDLVAPTTVRRGQDFSLKFLFTNLSGKCCKVFLSLRLDFGRKKLKMVKSTACLANQEAKEILLNFNESDVWPEARGDQTYFTVLATAHLEATGDILTKVDRIEFPKTSKKLSFLGRLH